MLTRSVGRALAVGAALLSCAACGDSPITPQELDASQSPSQVPLERRADRELLLAVLDDGIGQLHAYLARRMAEAQGGEARVREWLLGMLTQALHPAGAAATRPFALARARLAEQFPGEVEKSETQLTALLREALEQALAEGSLPAADPARDARALYDLALGWLQRALAGPEPAGEADAQALLGFALGGLRRGA